MLETNYARRGHRHSVDMLCELIRNDLDEPILHRMTDLSAYGAWLKTSFPMPIGAPIVLAFYPPGAGEMILFGEVRRARDRLPFNEQRGMAIGFTAVSQPERLSLLLALRRVADETEQLMRFAHLVN